MRSRILSQILIVLVFISATAQTSIPEQIDDYNVDLQLQSDGSAEITESIQLQLPYGAANLFQRNLDSSKNDGYQKIQAFLDGQPLESTTPAGGMEIRSKTDQTQILIHLPPSGSGIHQLTLSYRVEGLIQKGDSDRLEWRVFSSPSNGTIPTAKIQVTYPENAQLEVLPQISGVKAAYQETGHGFQFKLDQFQPDQNILLKAAFKPDTLTTVLPEWQAQKHTKENLILTIAPAGIWTGLILYLLISGFVLLDTRKYRQKRGETSDGERSVEELLSEEKPAIAGRLAQPGNSYSPAQSLAAIFDLCQHSVILLKQSPPRKFLPKDYLLLPGSIDAPLTCHEQVLMDLVFRSEKDRSEGVFLTDVGGCLVKSGHRLDQAIRKDMDDKGLLNQDGLKKQQRIQSVCLTGMILSLLIALAGWFMGDFSVSAGSQKGLELASFLTGGGAGVFLACLTAILICTSISILSDEGHKSSAEWLHFRQKLSDAIRNKNTLITEPIFSRYLPYAVGMKLGNSWVNAYLKHGENKVPSWLEEVSVNQEGMKDPTTIAPLMVTATASINTGDAGL